MSLPPPLAAALEESPDASRAAWLSAWATPPGDTSEADPGAARSRAALADALLTHIWGGEPGWAVVAIGGYGRGTLLRGSDLDLLLFQGEGSDPTVAERYLRRLWDLGLEVGHAVRDLAAVELSLRRDLASATGTLEGRLVTGDAELFTVLQGAVAAFCASPDRERFTSAKLVEADERHQRVGSEVCLLAPDLKRGRGQARDLELARLLAALEDGTPARGDRLRVLPGWGSALERWLSLTPGEWGRLAATEETLLAARGALHEVAPASGDRLDPIHQQALAQHLGYVERDGRLAVEVAMEEIYRAAKRVDLLLSRCKVRLAPAPATPLRQPLGPGVSSSGDFVVFDPDPPEDPRALLAVFEFAQEGKRRVASHALEVVRELRATLPLDAVTAAAFRRLLSGGKGVAQTLSDLHASGLLGRVLPEFGALECLAQADPYHVYTVDEHTLAALRALEGSQVHRSEAPRDPEREELLREDLFTQSPDRDLLRLALLLHDAGKVSGSLGHTERGVAMIRDVARRFGLTPGEQRHVKFLIAENPTLSHIAERRDVDSPETVEALLEVCGRDSRRLEHLYLLTCADIRGVSPEALSRWKDSLLTRVYERAAAELAGRSVPPSPDSVAGWLELLGSQADAARLEEHLALCTPDYLASVEPGELILHLDLIDELKANPTAAALRWAPAGGFERVWIACQDRAGLLSDLCGAISGAGWEIVGLAASARSDRVILDRFAVVPGPRVPAATEREAYLAETVRAVLSGEVQPGDLIAARLRSQPLLRTTDATGIRVRISNEVDPELTLVDVTAPDRIGLLHALTHALSESELNIHLAKVATKGQRAVAVFHVSGSAGQVTADQRDGLMRALGRAARG
ncbi:MAG: HD domain-containing protein [Planctomycetes bacterium]|nr:HD domain-containing protein [Planctomycetota bacterium]